MRTISLITILFLAVLGAGAPQAAENTVVRDPGLLGQLRDNAFQPWFEGLQSGDLENLRPLLREDIYAQYRTLFEQNTEYGQFLRDYYADASFEVTQVLDTEKGYLGEVAIYWPDGSTITMQLLASRPDASGRIELAPR